jgi:hypothetical protein
MQVLSTVAALHAGAVRVGLLTPKVAPMRGTRVKEVASVLLLNALTLAMACRWGAAHGWLCDVRIVWVSMQQPPCGQGPGLMCVLLFPLSCSTYHSMCGNGLAGEGGRSSARALRQAMCAK